MRPAARHSRHSPPSRWRTFARVRCHLAVLRMRAAASALGALIGRCGHAWPRWCRPPHHLQDTSTSTTPNNKKRTVRPMWVACSCRDSIIPHKKVAQSQICTEKPRRIIRRGCWLLLGVALHPLCACLQDVALHALACCCGGLPNLCACLLVWPDHDVIARGIIFCACSCVFFLFLFRLFSFAHTSAPFIVFLGLTVG